MIDNLTEKEILEYLMTSEFEEGLTPDEFKFLLIKFRNFYRSSAGRNEQLKSEVDGKISEIENLKGLHNQQMDQIKIEKADVENKLHFLSNKKLSYEERWKGRII